MGRAARARTARYGERVLRRVGSVVVVVLAVVTLAGCSVNRPAVRVEAYVEPGDRARERVVDAADRAETIGIDGVTLRRDGAGLAEPPEGMAGLATAATDSGARAELLLSNFSADVGDFSPAIGTALLSDADHRRAVANEVAHRASAIGAQGVQIDLESLRSRDRNGLVAFAGELEGAVHDELGDDARVSIAVMASTGVDGYRDAGYDLRALAEHVDRVVLMTYDQHGPWSGAGPVGALPWAERVVRAAEDEGVPADRIDLGIAGYGYVWGGEHDGEQVGPAEAGRIAGNAAEWSDRDGEWSATLGDGTELHWSDERSYRARVALAERLGLHGVALWSLGTTALPDA